MARHRHSLPQQDGADAVVKALDRDAGGRRLSGAFDQVRLTGLTADQPIRSSARSGLTHRDKPMSIQSGGQRRLLPQLLPDEGVLVTIGFTAAGVVGGLILGWALR